MRQQQPVGGSAICADADLDAGGLVAGIPVSPQQRRAQLFLVACG
jgi:hypothetical protein